jgi:hypothetical protein
LKHFVDLNEFKVNSLIRFCFMKRREIETFREVICLVLLCFVVYVFINRANVMFLEIYLVM